MQAAPGEQQADPAQMQQALQEREACEKGKPWFLSKEHSLSARPQSPQLLSLVGEWTRSKRSSSSYGRAWRPVRPDCLPPSGQGQTFLFYPFSANCFTRSSPRQGQFSVSGIRLVGNKFRGARMDPTLKHAARITAFMAQNIFLKSNLLFKSDSYIVVKWKTGPLTLEMLS